jgi:hypothetical protein
MKKKEEKKKKIQISKSDRNGNLLFTCAPG